MLLFFKFSGRMGLLTMLYLIQINTYNSVNVPTKRGFSSIEVWFIGMQAPILIAIFEYGILLAFKKFLSNTIKGKNLDPEKLIKNIDLFFFLVCIIYFAIFTIWYFVLYWISNSEIIMPKNDRSYIPNRKRTAKITLDGLLRGKITIML